MPLPSISGSVLIVRGDETLAEVVSDGCSARTRFQIASVSKQFTAAAVLLLAARGRLGLDDPIGRRLGGCPPAWRGITVHHLLTHSSGLGHWPDHPMIDPARPVQPAELLAAFHAVPPLFRPGAGWHYSSPAYVLLAAMVQEVTGESYHGHLRDRIFAPQGLHDTFAGSGGDRSDLATGCDAAGEPVGSWDLDVVNVGTGDVWSTARDLVAWIDALRAGRVLDEPYRSLMLTERVATGGDPDARGYGCGWYVGSVAGQPWFHHTGDQPGFRALAACLPELDCRVVLLSNSEATTGAAVAGLLEVALA